MRYPASEKAEIIHLVEQSHLPAKRTLDKLGIPRATVVQTSASAQARTESSYERGQIGGQRQIRARSASERTRRPVGPSSTSSRLTVPIGEPSKWTSFLPSNTIQNLRHNRRNLRMLDSNPIQGDQLSAYYYLKKTTPTRFSLIQTTWQCLRTPSDDTIKVNTRGMPRGLSTSSIAPADVRLRTVQSMAAPLKAMDPAFNARWRVMERFSFMATPKDMVRFVPIKVLRFGRTVAVVLRPFERFSIAARNSTMPNSMGQSNANLNNHNAGTAFPAEDFSLQLSWNVNVLTDAFTLEPPPAY